MTRAGPLDLFGALTQGRSYGDLLAHTVEVLIGPGLTVKVLDLSMLVRLKEELGREKDTAVLPILRRTLEERDRG
jgi:predicted nucleotidyltransferase